METQAQELMETSSGQAKYEHQHKAIVWRVPRLPKLGQGMIEVFIIVIHKMFRKFVSPKETNIISKRYYEIEPTDFCL